MSDDVKQVDVIEDSQPTEGDVESELLGIFGEADSKTEEPAPDHPRFKQIYGRMKELERNMEFLRSELEKRDMLVDELKTHNQRLAEAIEKISTKDEVDAEALIDAKINELKAAKAEALASGDMDKYDKISEELMDLKIKRKELEFTKNVRSSHQQVRLPAEVERWVESNKWFMENAAMRGAAIAIEAELANSPEWAHKPLAVRLAEVTRRVKEAFKISDDKPVAGGDMGSMGKTSSNKGLTPQQKAVARALGIPEQEYLKQLKLIESRSKGGA